MNRRIWLGWAGISVLLLFGCSRPASQQEAPAEVEPPVKVDTTSADPDAAEKVQAVYFRAAGEPEDAGARGQLGMAYEINGFRNAALETYDQAARLDPSDPRWTYFHATLLASLGQLDSALEKMQASIAIDALYVPAHLNRGQWLLDLGDPIQAEASYTQALTLDPSSRAAQLGAARALIQQGEAQRAADALVEYLAERPNDAYAYQLLGTAYRDLGDIDRAAEALARGRADAIPSRWPDPRVNEKLRFVAGYGADMLAGEGFLAANQVAEAIAVFESLLERRPDDPQALNNLAVAYRRDGQSPRALELLLESVETHPEYFPYYLNLTTIYHEMGEYERALQVAGRAIEFNPTLAQAHARLGELLIVQDRLPEALEAYETAISYEPDNRNYLIYAGCTAAEIDECERAVRWLEKGTLLAPNLFPGFLALGECKAKLGDFGGAETALARAGELFPESKTLAETLRLLEELKTQGS